MKLLQVYDPSMCCSSGVCGPGVDPILARFSADLEWLGKRGIRVERFGLSQQPEAFTANSGVTRTLATNGVDVLPLIVVDGQIVSKGVYPDRAQLAALTGLPPDTTVSSGVRLPVRKACC